MSNRIRGGVVLVLEDEPIIGFALEDILLHLGFEAVLLATTIGEARECLDDRKPDAAVLDVNIHGERSYGLAGMLAERKVPFVFATGYGDAQHPPELRSVPTVTKPYGVEDIRAALAAVGC
jgi:DNA-binding response OmpR family regulator